MKLKPCPFCGGNDVTIEESIEFHGHFYVICHSCEISTFKFNDPRKAVKRWNRRANDV